MRSGALFSASLSPWARERRSSREMCAIQARRKAASAADHDTIVIATNIEEGRLAIGIARGTLIEELAAKNKPVGDRALQQPAAKVVILHARGRVERPTTATVGRPRAPAFLKLNRKCFPYQAVAEPCILVTRRNLKHREDADLRPAVGLVDETVLDAEFHITQAKDVAPIIRTKIEKRYGDMQMYVRQGRGVEFKCRHGYGFSSFRALVVSRIYVGLGVLVVEGLGVIGHEGRTGMRERNNADHQDEPDSPLHAFWILLDHPVFLSKLEMGQHSATQRCGDHDHERLHLPEGKSDECRDGQCEIPTRMNGSGP